MLRKRLIKTTTTIAMVGALTFGSSAMVMAAPANSGGFAQEMFMQNGERPELPEGEAPTGERPELPNGEAPTGERPELPNGEAPTGERPELPNGEAPTGERPELPGGSNGNAPGMNMNGFDTDKVKTSIEALEDGDNKTNLQSLLSEYETAKSALETAIKDKSEDIDSCRESEMKAMEALRTALEEAGIDARPELPEDKADRESGTEPELPDDKGDAPTDNFFTMIVNWIRSLFSK